MNGQIKRADLAVIAGAGVFLGGISGVSIGAALALGPPWNLGAAGAGLFSGLMGLISMGAFTRLTLHLSPETPEPPEPEPARPQAQPWTITAAGIGAPSGATIEGRGHLVGFETDLLPQLRGGEPETRLLRKPDHLPERWDPLTSLELAYLLRDIFAVGSFPRSQFKGRRIAPYHRKLTRPMYDRAAAMFEEWGILTGRGIGTSGKLRDGLALTEALRLAQLDPEGIDWDFTSAIDLTGQRAASGPGRAGPGTSWSVSRITPDN